MFSELWRDWSESLLERQPSAIIPLAGGMLFLALILWQRRAIASFLRAERAQLRHDASICQAAWWQRNRYAILIGLLLYLFCFAVYLTTAHALRAVLGYEQYGSIFFGADHVEAFRNWTSLDTNPGIKGSHPLAPLLVVPLGTLFRILLGDAVAGILTMTAAFAAATVVVVYGTLTYVSRSAVGALAPSLFFGLSMSQLVFGAVPETYAIGGLTLALTYLLLIMCLQRGKLFFGRWLGAGVAAFGVLLTNLGAVFLCFAGAIQTMRPRATRVGGLLAFPLITLAVTVALSVVQKAIFPATIFFFTPFAYRLETPYLDPLLPLRAPLTLLQELGKNFFVLNFVGVLPDVFRYADIPRIKFTYYEVPLRFDWLGWIAVGLWLLLLGWGLYTNLTTPNQKRTSILIAVLLFHMGLHSLFNVPELFLYTANFTSLVLLLAFRPEAIRRRTVRLAWLLLAVLTGVNNLAVLRTLVALYAAP